MGQCSGIPHEKWLISLHAVKEFQCLAVYQIGSIRPSTILYIYHVVFQFHALLVIPQMVGIITVGKQLAIIAIKCITHLSPRIAGSANKPKSPLAKCRCRIASLFECVEQCVSIGWQWELPFGLKFYVATDISVPAMHPSQQARTRRRTHRSA